MRSRDLLVASVPVVGGLVVWGVLRGVRWVRAVGASRPVMRDPRVDELLERVGDLGARLGETVLEGASPGGHEVRVETVGGDACWRDLLFRALDLRGEDFGDVRGWLPRSEGAGSLLDELWLDEKFNARFGEVTSPAFTVWTGSWVYFPVRRNVGVHVRESVGCVPLRVDVSEYPVEHVG